MLHKEIPKWSEEFVDVIGIVGNVLQKQGPTITMHVTIEILV